jgi:glycosyltransferase involved in cell wall biosynthesis
VKPIDLSVVIPAYNEETNIRLGALDKVMRYLDTQDYSWEVVLVDDGSSDATGELLTAFAKANHGVRVIANPHQGKAATVITGMLQSDGEIVLFTDLDQATPINQLEAVLPQFKRGYDVVIGSRNSRRQGAPFTRRVMARGFMILRSLILGLRGIHDTQCGFKAFRKKAAHDIFGKLMLYGAKRQVAGSMVSAGFDVETLFLAKKLGYRIKEVPVEWHYVETRRVSPLKDSWEGFVDILRIRLNALQGKYQ